MNTKIEQNKVSFEKSGLFEQEAATLLMVATRMADMIGKIVPRYNDYEHEEVVRRKTQRENLVNAYSPAATQSAPLMATQTAPPGRR